jgi:hypothetical protein
MADIRQGPLVKYSAMCLENREESFTTSIVGAGLRQRWKRGQ